MKVILLENIKNLGKKHEIKSVSDGYGRNFLLKQGLAKIATDSEVAFVEREKKAEEAMWQKMVEKEQETAQKIKNVSFDIKMKVGEKGELFESVNEQKIAERIKQEGFEIDKENIVLDKPIKELGEHMALIKFKHAKEAEIKIKVTEEK